MERFGVRRSINIKTEVRGGRGVGGGGGGGEYLPAPHAPPTPAPHLRPENKRKFLLGKRENTNLSYVATSSRSEVLISVVVRHQRQCQQQRRRRLLPYRRVYLAGELGGLVVPL